MKQIGFIGLGTMGAPMALNLLRKGYAVTVYNRSADKAAELVQSGASLAATPAEAVSGAEVLFTMLSNDSAVESVFYGENGVLEKAGEGLTVIDSSTISPALSQRLHADLGQRGAKFLDAPVTGSKPAAEAATLVFMVGGDRPVFDAQHALLSDLGSKVLYMGPSGSGSYTKLAHNTIVGINAIGLMEGLSIATKAGLAPEQFLQIVQAGSAGSKQAELKGPKILARDFSNQFSLKLMLKDLLLASELTGKFQLPAPVLHAATTVFQMGLSKGLGEDDLAAAIQCYEEWMNEKVEKKDGQ
ncbi:NAD(P)-dependent oxidoreductase [Paenibacillus sp. UNC499MF]|uniref:NAD(P)-dependent oxidoreductase n=1 Tax=Paenibacillus sp. UNC499MF TaxID=1502751 RepID=UPI0008A065EA|nr:NAD(P)-dependent oxidoreductase [Paenibacillus sp. UNC499MF]SEF81411.1 3-hydroxyisobutyrate dehydrogenase [Paenibacillus sp. UNC499MF]